MNARQAKNKLMDLGLSVTDLAREMCEEFPSVSEKGMRSMIDNMIWGRNYYPRYAKHLNEQYGFNFTRPKHMLSTRQLLKQHA